MKVKLGEIMNAIPVLQKVAQAQLPAAIAFNLYKVTKVLEVERENFEGRRMDLIKKYSDGFNEETREYTFPEDNRAKFMKEINELLNVEVELNTPVVNLVDSGINISVAEIEAISFLLPEEL